MECSLPGSSVHGILQARILEWVAIPFSRGSFQPRDRICVSWLWFITVKGHRLKSGIGKGAWNRSQEKSGVKLPFLLSQWSYVDGTSFFHQWCVTTKQGLTSHRGSHNFRCLESFPMAPHSSPLAWKIPWTEEPGRLQSMGSLRVGHDWATSLSLFTFMHWRRKWQPTPVFLPGESQGRVSLVGCRLWGRTGSDTTEVT